MYECSLKRMSDKIRTMSRYGDAGHGGITRYSLSKEANMARAEFKKRMEAIGAEVVCDDVACMYATLPGSDPNAKRIVMGSHCDSVKNGGNYDGILGVITGMEVLETVAAEKIPHRHPLTAMIWTNEEGSLYPPVMMASGILCRDYLPKDIQVSYEYDDMMKSAPTDESEFASFGEALAASPYKGDKANRISPENACAMFETHLEQGPILADAGNAVGAVQLVMGMFHYSITFRGFAAHAGTFPMAKRHDALYAAAAFLCQLHERYNAYNREVAAAGEPEFVYTTGEISIHPCLHTVIPDEAVLSLDVRHPNPDVRKKCLDILRELAVREWKQCTCEIKEQWVRDTVLFDKTLVTCVEEAMEEMGVKWQRILSGAGHDAQFCAYMIPTAMIFARTKDGLSHCEAEYVSDEDCTVAATAALNAVLKADERI